MSMNDFLQSIGYGHWILPALLIIPTVGALAIWALGSRTAGDDATDDVVSGRANGPRTIALVTFLVEFVVSLGLWWSVIPVGTRSSLTAPVRTRRARSPCRAR